MDIEDLGVTTYSRDQLAAMVAQQQGQTQGTAADSAPGSALPGLPSMLPHPTQRAALPVPLKVHQLSQHQQLYVPSTLQQLMQVGAGQGLGPRGGCVAGSAGISRVTGGASVVYAVFVVLQCKRK